MAPFSAFLDTVIFEIKYAYGHLYYDRCGQTIVDIEKFNDEWYGQPTNIQIGAAECPSKNFKANFNTEKYDFVAERAKTKDISEIAQNAAAIWKVVQANLSLSEFNRIGARYIFLFPATTVEEANSLVSKSEFNITIPDNLHELDYTVKERNITCTFAKDSIEYRVNLASVIRSEGLQPHEILKAHPSTLSKRQREYRLEKLKQMSEYSANPMYCVMLDVDCSQVRPETPKADQFIIDMHKNTRKDLFPILEKICN
jgi:hypothetical protein